MGSLSKANFMLIVGFVVVLAFGVNEIIIFNIFDQKRKLLVIVYASLFIVSNNQVNLFVGICLYPLASGLQNNSNCNLPVPHPADYVRTPKGHQPGAVLRNDAPV